MYTFIQYIKFLFRSFNLHGIHSPFVFRFNKDCIKDNVNYKAYTKLRSYRQRLYKNNTIIYIEDFGAGSRVFKSNERQVNKIAKTAGITRKRAQLLYRMTRFFEPSNVLELGTSLGMGTSAIYLGNKFAHITTVEGCQETSAIAQEQFNHFQLNNIQLINSDFTKALKKDEIANARFDLIYLDGNHNKAATLFYFNELLSNVNDDSVMIIDDIFWSKEMTEAWEIIKKNIKVTVTIDTFFWGIVFFRKEQEKQHFTIRV